MDFEVANLLLATVNFEPWLQRIGIAFLVASAELLSRYLGPVVQN